MATKARRHIHKYHKVTLSFGQVWACALPECSHYMPQHMTPMITGKASICWECNEPMILDSNSMNEDKPRCGLCRVGQLLELHKEKEVS